jgi:hypothetical protein
MTDLLDRLQTALADRYHIERQLGRVALSPAAAAPRRTPP